ncbi:bifunctional 5,10-methylenetetrahydrofolate dehydrogenase/5,10-methenyltetrahydrofolate cyclohydrolase [Streptomyces sp. NBC_01340]|jgi:methylenetetrahydrofolate dehydrogenase (NADP+)/methenyltetrahydrofolate cyclohydrolase|uniref:bifunctional 5,10-methylenetetrahydrofolate dehydrogenase/5,10-methenyltetrahydrofolate cyclohydrolase n=1 Tax=unclassified Streptomyces TaxID=2593676 RepID=UPI0022598873|nr:MULTISPECIES: bifunctional 5,10-methylenetetrahydrofolate dehydrogenase/5,10-methenyltetrahydrofolate cyclohydrolase [unclassified Streptomyces]MCX4451869.1 bifunctional 5,10-methylenetetrahydrofolate dehydrogenase/5,10-methenyltetrahydrofolate cyclohydrolase [Streptomyces sp. NBC_01719]MCX4491229.1 bifunctional 5,10-methylenetetrahydrofolate dehydrogenase/5,10-methenyltetrahydrofolate cyclohydrolase [Streptomyces sp. NBC_01728]MCX4594189.1 bifunctional 5,10-methylenetetrahydrofolate dehydrog
MSQAQLMDGAGLARRIVEETAKRAAELTGRTGTAPCLATVLVGEDPASVTYVRMKQNRSRKAGIESRHVALPADTTTAELVDTLKALSGDPAVHGILLQHPVGPHIDERAAFEAIAPEKDVDGVTLSSYSAMSFGLPGFVSCTPGGIMRLLDEYDVDPAGRRAVVVGRSAILGKPVGMLLLGRDATVTYCHSRTTGLSSVVREADIVVAAVGRPRLIRGEDIKPGAVVIDAGYNPGNVGDVDFDTARERARLITPVPGGVGPMTIAVLLEQTVTGAERQLGLR